MTDAAPRPTADELLAALTARVRAYAASPSDQMLAYLIARVRVTERLKVLDRAFRDELRHPRPATYGGDNPSEQVREVFDRLRPKNAHLELEYQKHFIQVVGRVLRGEDVSRNALLEAYAAASCHRGVDEARQPRVLEARARVDKEMRARFSEAEIGMLHRARRVEARDYPAVLREARLRLQAGQGPRSLADPMPANSVLSGIPPQGHDHGRMSDRPSGARPGPAGSAPAHHPRS